MQGMEEEVLLALMDHGEGTGNIAPTKLSNGMPSLESALEACTMGRTKGRYGCFSAGCRDQGRAEPYSKNYMYHLHQDHSKWQKL